MAGDALAAYQRASEQAPGIARYRLSLAQLLGNLRRFDEALRQLELARELDPVSTSIDFDMGIIYTASGRSTTAHCRLGRMRAWTCVAMPLLILVSGLSVEGQDSSACTAFTNLSSPSWSHRKNMIAFAVDCHLM